MLSGRQYNPTCSNEELEYKEGHRVGIQINKMQIQFSCLQCLEDISLDYVILKRTITAESLYILSNIQT